MKLSVVMPTFNEASHISAQLDALTDQDYRGEWELVIADNGSNDGTRELVGQRADRLPVRLVDASERRGCGPARNVGVDAATGDALLFCDGDDIVDRGWISAHAETLETAALSAGAVVFFEDVPSSDVAAPPRPPTLLGWLPYAQGANCGVRREAYEAVGGFNESNPFAEDVEFSWRVQLAGFTFAYTPAAVVHKRTRGSARDQFVQSFRYGACDVDLYRRFREFGARRPSARDTGRTYLGLVGRLPAIGSSEVRERWLRQVGRRSGRLVGSFRERTFLP